MYSLPSMKLWKLTAASFIGRGRGRSDFYFLFTSKYVIMVQAGIHCNDVHEILLLRGGLVLGFLLQAKANFVVAPELHVKQNVPTNSITFGIHPVSVFRIF